MKLDSMKPVKHPFDRCTISPHSIYVAPLLGMVNKHVRSQCKEYARGEITKKMLGRGTSMLNRIVSINYIRKQL